MISLCAIISCLIWLPARWQRLLGQRFCISQTEFHLRSNVATTRSGLLGRPSSRHAGDSFPQRNWIFSSEAWKRHSELLLNVFLCRVMNYLRSFINHVTKTCQKLFHALGSYFNCPRKLLYLWTSSNNRSLMFYCFCCSGYKLSWHRLTFFSISSHCR